MSFMPQRNCLIAVAATSVLMFAATLNADVLIYKIKSSSSEIGAGRTAQTSEAGFLVMDPQEGQMAIIGTVPSQHRFSVTWPSNSILSQISAAGGKNYTVFSIPGRGGTLSAEGLNSALDAGTARVWNRPKLFRFTSSEMDLLASVTNGNKPISVVIDGDSLSCPVTGLTTNGNWPYALTNNSIFDGACDFTNFAVSGNTASNILWNYSFATQPAISNSVAKGEVTFWFDYSGINDLLHPAFGTNELISANSNLWMMARSQGAKVVAFALPYSWNFPAQSVDITNYNIWIQAQSNQWDYLVQPLEVLTAADSPDELHYGYAGNARLARYVFDLVFADQLAAGTANGTLAFDQSDTISQNTNTGGDIAITVNNLTQSLLNSGYTLAQQP
jgi:hypothetical protein